MQRSSSKIPAAASAISSNAGTAKYFYVSVGFLECPIKFMVNGNCSVDIILSHIKTEALKRLQAQIKADTEALTLSPPEIGTETSDGRLELEKLIELKSTRHHFSKSYHLPLNFML